MTKLQRVNKQIRNLGLTAWDLKEWEKVKLLPKGDKLRPELKTFKYGLVPDEDTSGFIKFCKNISGVRGIEYTCGIGKWKQKEK